MRKAGSRGVSLANDYRIAFPERSSGRVAATALTSTRPLQWLPGGHCIDLHAATIRIDHKEHHPSVINVRRTAGPTEGVDNRAEIEALGRIFPESVTSRDDASVTVRRPQGAAMSRPNRRSSRRDGKRSGAVYRNRVGGREIPSWGSCELRVRCFYLRSRDQFTRDVGRSERQGLSW